MSSPFSSSSKPAYGGFSTSSPVASRSQWWSQDGQGGGGASGTGSHSILDDRMDDVEQAANHLPGFLTASGRGRTSAAESTPASSSQQSWLSSSGPRGMPSPPSGRFGSGGLFDRTNTSPYNSPQIQHALPISRSQEDAPPLPSFDGDMYDGLASYQTEYSSPPSSRIIPPPSQPITTNSNPLTSTIIVFGPPMTMLQPLIQHFEQFGQITAAAPDQNGGNWVTITYRTEQEASRAVTKNGEVLGGIWMTGVKWADPTRPSSSLYDSSLRPSPSHSPKPLQNPTAFTSSSSRPLQLAPSSSAFRRGEQQQAVQPGTMAPKPVPANATTGEGGKSGVFGKLGELVFGF